VADSKHFGPETKTLSDISPADLIAKSRRNAPLSDTRRTVSMSALGAVEAEFKPAARQPRAATTPAKQPETDAARTMMLDIGDMEPQQPIETVHEPPEINRTQHSMPSGRNSDPRLLLWREPDSERAAAFRILRHHLMDHGRPQVIVVSSASPGEGKTTCAVNLALALAECNRARVLLVEATVRAPQLAKIFNFKPPWCFAEQLSAHREQPLMPWSTVQVTEAHLHIAAMDPSLAQRQILDAPAFAIAMERLRLANFDHIVIDAPAVLGSAEVNLLQDAADGVLLVARSKQATARTLRKAVEQLSPTKVIGTILLK